MKKLIKYLGGYSECERLRAVRAASSYRIRGREFTRTDLESEMLRHRIKNNKYEPGDRVMLRDPNFRPHKYFVTEVLSGGRIELKTAERGWPVPESCWGMYYGNASGLRHVVLAGVVRA